MEHLLDERLLSSSSGGAFAADAGGAAAANPLAGARLAPGNIRSLILEKEKELHDINEYRIRTLEALLRDKESAANSYKQKFIKLQEDFKYNLKLLEGRDEELALYDTNFANLKGVVRDREADVSELKAHVADLEADLAQERARSHEQELFFTQKLKDARAQMDGARWQFDDELRRVKDDAAAQVRTLERRMREQDDEVEAQRRELGVTFDEMLRQRESEFKSALDSAASASRELELKLKATQRERDGYRDRLDETKSKLENVQQLVAESEKELKATEWQLADVRAASDAKVQSLERDVAALQDVKQALLDEYEGKMAELLQSLQAVEAAFVQQKAQFQDDLAAQQRRKDEELQSHTLRLEAKIASLTSKLREQTDAVEQMQNELKHAKWTSDEQLAEKDRAFERALSERQDMEEQHQAVVSDYKTRLWQCEREHASLQAKLADTATQLQVQKEREKVLRQELVESSEKLDDAKREVVTLNLRWENKWQDHEMELSSRSDARIRELSQVKAQLVSEKQALEERLVHAETELQRLRSEVYALRSNARIAESFGVSFGSAARDDRGGRASTGDDAAKSNRASSVAPSPLWSEDNGELSPITGMSPLLSDTPTKRESAQSTESGAMSASASVEALQAENAKLRDVIHQMKDALAQQANEVADSASPDRSSSNSASDTKALAAELRESQKQCVLLEAKLVTLEAQQQTSGAASGALVGLGSDTKVFDALSSVSAQLAACNAELAEANRTIEAQTKRIAELEAQLEALGRSGDGGDETGGTIGGRALASDRVRSDAQVAELKRKLASATSDIERLVRERSQLMELSNQLRADLRKVRERHSSTSLDGAEQATAFAGKKDFENLVAELSRSLEEARVHNKTLKKELRRMLKQQQILASGQGASTSSVPPPPPPSSLVSLSLQRDDEDRGHAESRAARREARQRTTSVAGSAAATDVTSSEGRRRSSTLSMMKALDESSPRPSVAPSHAQRSGGDFDAELLSLVRSKRPSEVESAASPFQRERRRSSSRSSAATADTIALPQRTRSTSSASRPASIRERVDEDEGDESGDESDGVTASARRRARASSTSSSAAADGRSGPKTALSSLFQRDRLDSIASADDATTTAKEMLLLAGKKAERSSSLATFASARSSDRATPSQKSASAKLKELQSRRSEMVAERKRVRNYSVAT